MPIHIFIHSKYQEHMLYRVGLLENLADICVCCANATSEIGNMCAKGVSPSRHLFSLECALFVQ